MCVYEIVCVIVLSPLSSTYIKYSVLQSVTNISVKLISATDNTSTSFDYGLGNAIVENPLVDAANGLDAHIDHDRISISVLKNKGMSAIGSNIKPYPEDLENTSGGVSAQHRKYSSRYLINAAPRL